MVSGFTTFAQYLADDHPLGHLWSKAFLSLLRRKRCVWKQYGQKMYVCNVMEWNGIECNVMQCNVYMFVCSFVRSFVRLHACMHGWMDVCIIYIYMTVVRPSCLFKQKSLQLSCLMLWVSPCFQTQPEQMSRWTMNCTASRSTWCQPWIHNPKSCINWGNVFWIGFNGI